MFVLHQQYMTLNNKGSFFLNGLVIIYAKLLLFHGSQWWQCRQPESGQLIWANSGTSFISNLSRVGQVDVAHLISSGMTNLGWCWARSSFITAQWWQCRQPESGQLIWPDSGATFMPNLSWVGQLVAAQLISSSMLSSGWFWTRLFWLPGFGGCVILTAWMHRILIDNVLPIKIFNNFHLELQLQSSNRNCPFRTKDIGINMWPIIINQASKLELISVLKLYQKYS